MSRRRIRSWDAEPEPKKAAPKKKARRKAKPKADDEFDFDIGGESIEPVDQVVAKAPRANLEFDFDNPPGEAENETRRVAECLALDLDTECPVCRRLGDCDCNETERAFQRRVRFNAESDGVPICKCCGGAWTCVLIPRAGTSPPFNLSHMVPIWGCAGCHGTSLATVLINATRAK